MLFEIFVFCWIYAKIFSFFDPDDDLDYPDDDDDQ